MKVLGSVTLLLVAAPALVGAQTAPAERPVRILANVNFNATSRTFEERSTFSAFLEDGSTSRSYDGGTGVGFEVGAIYNITPALGVLGSFEVLHGEHDASYDVTAPHPLFFNQPRSANGELAGLEYNEQALNLDAVYTLSSGRFVVDVFGGATLFFTETELVDEIATESIYPFDELTIANASTTKLKENPIGFNVGGAVTYRVTPVVGVSFQARFSRATMTLERDAGEPLDIETGGFRIGGGIRIAF